MSFSLSQRDPLVGSTQGSPLLFLIELAVWEEVLRLGRKGGPSEEDFSWARQEAALILACHGDRLLFADPRPRSGPSTAEVFQVLVRSLALLAYCPGGVSFCGRKFVAEEMLSAGKKADRLQHEAQAQQLPRWSQSQDKPEQQA